MLKSTAAMAATAFEQRAVLAENLLAKISQRIAVLRAEAEAKEIQRLEAENAALRQQVEQAKQALRQAEIAHGKLQVPLPGEKGATAPPPAASAAPAAAAGAAAPAAEGQKKEKKAAASGEKPAGDKPAKAAKAPKQAKAAAPVNDTVDVGRIDFRVGKIIEVGRHPNADSLYVEKIDVGEAQPRTVLSGLVKFVPQEALQNRMIVLCANLKPKPMRGIESHGMLMCASTDDRIEPIIPPEGAAPGDVVVFEGYTNRPDAQLNPKKNVLEVVLADLRVNDQGLACYKNTPFTIAGKGPCTSSLKGAPIK